MKQEQFLNVLDRDEAERRFHAVLDLTPLESEEIPLGQALGRVLACDVTAPVDVPGFDRSNVDGFALRAEDMFGATEECARVLKLSGEVLCPGHIPTKVLGEGLASAIATGGMIPRGADAVVMVEHTEVESDLLVRRPVTPGANITFAGTDIGRGETVFRRGDLLTSRETGVLAAIGVDRVSVVRRPRVAILSTGDELIEPGRAITPGMVFDSNSRIIADSVCELGGEPVMLGIVRDDESALLAALKQALDYDVVLLSGGTSKGEGDLCYRVIAELGPPGIVAHGVALKPGKPLCLAAVRRPGRRVVPVVILPGFPTSAIFTFHEFVAPVIRSLCGRREERATTVAARLPMRLNSERGRTEYSLVTLIEMENSIPVAFPMGQGSGSVTTFSRADGFIVIPRQTEYIESGSLVEVHLLSAGVKPADLVIIGSHCVGVDYLLGRLQERGLHCKFIALGSTAGLEAARRGECDLAGIHLLDPVSNTYNRRFVTDDLVLLPGYRRMQGLVFRRGDNRFEGSDVSLVIRHVANDPDCVMVNRNRGSGTRILIDRLLAGVQPPGYSVETRSHNAVAAAVAQGRADWGVAIDVVCKGLNLGFLPLQAEEFDFVCPKNRLQRAGVQAFREIIAEAATAKALADMGLRMD